MGDGFMLDSIKSQIQASCLVKQQMLEDEQALQQIEDMAVRCIEALRNGNKILLAGNGGSAADAQHIAAELVCRFETERRALPALALPTNSSTMTAIANDYHYDTVYLRQLHALAKPGDVFIGISTSGNSPNIVKAIDACQELGVIAIGMTGQSGGKLLEKCDLCVRVPATNTARVQEAHILVGHIVCSQIDKAFTE